MGCQRFDGLEGGLWCDCSFRRWAAAAVAMAAEGVKSAIPPPAHPTYDLLHVIRLALAEDAGDQGAYLNFLLIRVSEF